MLLSEGGGFLQAAAARNTPAHSLPLPTLTRCGRRLQVCVVTGGNAGIGFATAAKLAERGAHVVLACRSAERGRAAAAELSRRPPLPGHTRGRVDFAQLDLCSLSGVRSFVHDFNRSHRRLDVLVCNAGIMSPPSRLVSPDGLELQFQVWDVAMHAVCLAW